MKKLEELGISPAPWSFTKPSKLHDAAILCNEKNRGGLKRTYMFAVRYPYSGLLNDIVCKHEQEANACLIAAAPKLYAKAWELLAAFDDRVMTPEHIKSLRAALAEAAGESEVTK